MVLEATNFISSIVPTYFDDFEALAAEAEWDSHELGRMETVAHWEGLLEYVESARFKKEDERAGLSEEQHIGLASAEVQFAENIKAELEDIRNISFHLAIKHSVDVLWQSNWREPPRGCICMLWDHMVPSKKKSYVI